MLCAIWYHLYNLKNFKNTHGGVLILVKVVFFQGVFQVFKLYKWYEVFHFQKLKSRKLWKIWIFLPLVCLQMKCCFRLQATSFHFPFGRITTQSSIPCQLFGWSSSKLIYLVTDLSSQTHCSSMDKSVNPIYTLIWYNLKKHSLNFEKIWSQTKTSSSIQRSS